jgi:hypothetical protein
MRTLLQFPSTGSFNGNAVPDAQGGYFIAWSDQNGTSVVEVLDVRPDAKGKWSVFATSNAVNTINGPITSYLAPDGAGGANIASCTKQVAGLDVIANVRFQDQVLNATPIFHSRDGGTCEWTGIANWSPTLFYVSASDRASFNVIEQVTFTDHWAVTQIALPGTPDIDRIVGALSSTELVGMNDHGSTKKGELFTATISGSTATYKTLYTLNAKLGTRFYSVAPTTGDQYIGSTLGSDSDGFTVDVVQGKTKLTAKRIAANTALGEQISALPDGSQFWEAALADTFGDTSYASHYVAVDGKYQLQSKARIAGNFIPFQIIAREDGSADGLVIDSNTGACLLVNFSAGTP